MAGFHLGAITPQRYIASLVAKRSINIKLRPQELACLAKIRKITRDTGSVVDFIENYRGPRNELLRVLEGRRKILARAAKGLITFDEFRSMLPTEKHKHIWDRYREKGWQVRFERGSISERSPYAPGAIDKENKTIKFQIRLDIVPPSLIFAHEVRHLKQLELIEINWEKIRSHILSMPSMKIIGDKSDNRIRIFLEEYLLTKIPDPIIREIIALAMERDAYLEELNLYSDLIRRDPRQKTRILDDLLLRRDTDIEAIVFGVEMKSRGLSAVSAKAVSGRSLDSIIAACKGLNLEEFDRINGGIEVPVLLNLDFGTIKQVTPKILIKIREALDENYMERIKYVGEGLSAEEAQALVDYIANPIHINPNGGEYFPLTLKDLRYAIRALGNYNREQGTTIGIEEMYKLVEQPPPENYDIIIYNILCALKTSNHPKRAIMFLNALERSSSLFDFLDNGNSIYELFSFLNFCAQDSETENIDPARFTSFIAAWTDRYKRAAEGNVDYRVAVNDHFVSLLSRAGRNYLRAIGATEQIDSTP